MARINLVPPSKLCDQHLLAEVKELVRIPNRVASGKADLGADRPSGYVLGAGHVRFFYDKLGFLRGRYVALLEECRARGFKVQDCWVLDGVEFASMLCRDYLPTKAEVASNRARIEESKARMRREPRWTKRATV